MGMDGAELVVAEAQEAGEIPETARFKRQFLQASVW